MGNFPTGPFRRYERHRKENSCQTSWHTICVKAWMAGLNPFSPPRGERGKKQNGKPKKEGWKDEVQTLWRDHGLRKVLW